MLHLASYALYKLFTEWQADGFEIPGFNMGPPVAETKAEKAVKSPKRVNWPENAHDTHPTRLLCIVSTVSA